MTLWTRMLLLVSTSLSFAASATQLVIDTWGDEITLWQSTIIPAFEQRHPGIKLVVRQMESWSYIEEQSERLKSNQASDLIMCRPFDSALNWFEQGYLEEITELDGIENFPSFALAAWQTNSGAQTFCLPLGSVIHGFFYNKQIFNELGLKEPQTEHEFFKLLQRVEEQGRYTPMAFGAKDAWAVSELGWQNIGPNYWHGEDGRVALLEGETRIDSQPFQRAFEHLARWADYMGEGYVERGYEDAWKLFKQGDAAIAPGGSWEIVNLRDEVELGVFRAPVPDGNQQCYITDHTDKGIAINRSSPNREHAENLLRWMTTKEFASLFAQSEPGFFSLSNHFIELDDPVAQTMASWRIDCDVSIRATTQILSRGTPNFNDHVSEVSHAVLSQQMTPAQATQSLQVGLNQWYPPQAKASTAAMTNASCE
ncbi:ABC transporter substrate-binding protein [Vibrio sp. WXL103]|uniref:ABC transporter substrate-binding protein n=1 Tax=Vibrio sp. WXL103 TaxID=3450710 RepID=UPI003EC69D7A